VKTLDTKETEIKKRRTEKYVERERTYFDRLSTRVIKSAAKERVCTYASSSSAQTYPLLFLLL
jgi:hypothetical protein